MTEEWRAVPDYPNYEVSSLGRVRGPNGLKALWRSHGYLRVTLHCRGAAFKLRVARLVLLAFIGPCPEGSEACHDDGDREHNQLRNLRWDTHQANIDDRNAHGATARGERQGLAKLSDAEVRRIRQARGRVTQTDLAQRFGVSQATISRVQLWQVWAHV